MEVYGADAPSYHVLVASQRLTKWFLSDFRVERQKRLGLLVSSDAASPVLSSNPCCNASWRNFLIVASVVSGWNPVGTARVDLSAASSMSFGVAYFICSS